MKKLNKKGFTIVELVIVIAVIAILAAVMIPTFSGIIDKANKSAALQEAKSAHTALLYHLESPDKLEVKDKVDAYIVVDGEYYFEVNDGKLNALTAAPSNLVKEKTNAEDYEKTTVADVGANVEVYIYTAAVVNAG